MKRLLCLLFFASALRAEEKSDKVDLFAIIWARYKLSETTNEIYSDKSEKSKKNNEDIERFKQETDKKRENINSFNPKTPPNAKDTWDGEKRENPFLYEVIEERHKTGEPTTKMEKYAETYKFALAAPEITLQFNSLNKHFKPEDQLVFKQFAINYVFPHETELSNQSLNAQIEYQEKIKNALVKIKKKREEENKENQETKTMQSNLVWALHHPEQMKKFRKFYVEEAKERQRQDSDK